MSHLNRQAPKIFASLVDNINVMLLSTERGTLSNLIIDRLLWEITIFSFTSSYSVTMCRYDREVPENSDDDDLDWTGAPVFATEPQFDANSSSKYAQDIPNSCNSMCLCGFHRACFISMNKMLMFYVLSIGYWT
mgnify:CR=1 FL=1